MQKKPNRLTERRFLLPFLLITALFFLWGFARAILDVLNKHLQNEMEISITQSSLIQVTTFLGYFLMAIPAGLFINRKGYRRGVVLGLLLFAVGSLLFIPGAWMGSFRVFLFALFVIGCGLVFLETAANPYVTELGPKSTATSRLNLSQSFNGLGCLFATFVVGQFFFRGDGEAGNVALPYTVLGVIVLLIALVFSRMELPEIVHDEGEAPAGGLRNLSELFRRPLFVFGLAALLSYEVAEISVNSYFINFVTGMGWMDDNLASVVLTCALAFFMIGRFFGSWIMKTIRPERMLLLCATGTVICTCLVLSDLGRVSMMALIAVYLFEAIMFPTIFSLALKGLGNLTKSAASLLMMTPVGGCGFLLMGWMADSGSLLLPFLVPLLGFLVVMAYAVRMTRER
ncbi:glucose/galactose MFS transporter [Prevotella sp. oral taxon 376]|uniref:sugar MFS transporter n=1 Tax=Prevotella sp. oral taxon 376 TaxID=712466 RepID=UPI000D1DBA81|nr:sugar MFS transporter [Prevotella sp. oral taxon 376]PTL34141.1 glucose/galactose MFS transporter [Prevotella sp. oral taxon 376]